MSRYMNHFKKLFVSLLMLTMLTMLAVPCFANTVKLTLNGNAIKVATAPVQENGTTLVPLRVISENLGATVDYNSTSKVITIQKANDTITLTLGQTNVSVNGKTSSLSSAPKVINHTTMVPLRFVSETLNCKVNWDSKTQTVAITTAASTSNVTASASDLPIATIVVKDFGTITLELYPDMAPNTVNNFMSLANSKFYDGLIFHRVISGFMIQGGDPQGTGTGGPGYSIAGEFSANGFTQNTLSHTKGIISMARTYAPDSAGSQFFITSGEPTYLDGQYAAFGKVISGIEVVDAIQSVETTSSDKPVKDVVIESIRVTGDYDEPIKVGDK